MNSSNQKLVSLRTALILLLGALTGVGAGVLTVAAGGFGPPGSSAAAPRSPER